MKSLLRSPLLQFCICIGYHLFVLYLRATVSYSEKRCLQHVDMPFLDEFREELQEERDGEQTDVHAVYIGIGGYDDLVIAQRLHAVFDIQRCLKQVELLVLVDHFLGQTERIERFAAQRTPPACSHRDSW